MDGKIYIVHWRDENKETGVVGVFDDKEAAENAYDTMESNGAKDRQYYLDDYALNTLGA